MLICNNKQIKQIMAGYTIPASFLNGVIKSGFVSKVDDQFERHVLSENLEKILKINKPRRSNRLQRKKTTSSSTFYHHDVVHKSTPKANRNLRFCDVYRRIPIRKINCLGRVTRNYIPKEKSAFLFGIQTEIERINARLQGLKVDMSNRKRHISDEENKENVAIKYPCVPKCKWVYQTPPNRKLTYHNVDKADNCLQPAVVERNADGGTVIYEMSSKVRVDLSQFNHRQDIKIDRRFMIPTNVEIDKSESSKTYELEDHFLALTCRPKKAQTAQSRVNNPLKRKCDFYDPNSTPPGVARISNNKMEVENFDSNFTFINNSLANAEKSFTFQFTSEESGGQGGGGGGGGGGNTTGKMFDFGGNEMDSFNFDL